MFCRLVVLVRLSVPVEEIDWKGSSPKWPIMCWWALTYLLVWLPLGRIYWRKKFVSTLTQLRLRPATVYSLAMLSFIVHYFCRSWGVGCLDPLKICRRVRVCSDPPPPICHVLWFKTQSQTFVRIYRWKQYMYDILFLFLHKHLFVLSVCLCLLSAATCLHSVHSHKNAQYKNYT